MAGIFNRSCLFKPQPGTQPIREEMLWTSLPTTLMKREQDDWKQGFTKGSDKWVSAERKRKRRGAGVRLMAVCWSGNTPILNGDCARHPPSSPPRPSIAPPPHAHYIHKCFIISAFVVESLRLEKKKKKTHQWTSCARSLHSLFLSLFLSLASTPSFTHGWVWQVVFRSNDTLLLASSGRTNTHTLSQGIACIIRHLI